MLVFLIAESQLSVGASKEDPLPAVALNLLEIRLNYHGIQLRWAAKKIIRLGFRTGLFTDSVRRLSNRVLPVRPATADLFRPHSALTETKTSPLRFGLLPEQRNRTGHFTLFPTSNAKVVSLVLYKPLTLWSKLSLQWEIFHRR